MSALNVEKLYAIPLLLDTYGCLLTEKQRQALSLAYEEDCSLAEIAEINGSTRQAAHDLLLRGEALLREYESLLQLLAERAERETLKSSLRSAMEVGDRATIEELLCRL